MSTQNGTCAECGAKFKITECGDRTPKKYCSKKCRARKNIRAHYVRQNERIAGKLKNAKSPSTEK